MKTIGLQATDRIFGDTIALGLDGFPALAVGDRVVFSLNGGATFIDNNFGLEEWSGGAGTGVTDFSVLQTAAPSGSARIEFLMQESAVPRPLAGVRMFILSGTEPGGAITGQSVKVNLPQVPGLDIVLKAEVFDAGNNLKGTALIVMFESTLEPGLSEQQTRQAIANQIGQQMQRRASFGPGLAGLLTGHGFGGQGLQGVGGELAPLLGRLEQSLLGGSLPLSLSLDLDGDLQSGEFAFSTNAYRQWQQRSNANQRSAVGSAQSGSNDAVLADSTNLWIKGRFGKSSDSRRDDEVKSDFGFVYIGADVPYSTNTRLGLMAEVDWFEEKAAGTGADGEGRGWMVGPYLVSRLAENLIADVRGAYGQSDNKISPIGTFSDSYDTQRWLLEANLTGQWEDGNWEVLPAIGLQYQEETQEAYIDTVGQRIGGQTVSLGSLSFGPTVYYNLERNDGSIIRPMLGLKGIWNFDNPDLYNINRTSGLSGQPFGDDKLRAQLKLGIQASLSSGAHWQGSYTYDGIGVSGLDAHAVELSVSTLLGESGPFKGVKLIGDFRMSDASDEQLDVKLSVPLP
ncbi:MAG: autotransporter outer membrane beta-barrel domain-containing protein [Chromatiales bacterium]